MILFFILTHAGINMSLQEIAQLANVTILDPDTDSKWKHEFKSDCYQKKVKSKIDEYQNILKNPKAN